MRRKNAGRSRTSPRKLNARQRRRLTVIFALVFGVFGGGRAVHAREVPFAASAAISTTAANAFSVSAADIDGDGDLDALSASFNDDKIAWYENTGDGSTWTLHTISTAANSAASVAATDIDGDGDLDVLSASFDDDKVAWYENAGGGTAWTLRTIATSANGASSVFAADVDGDGDVDVLSASVLDDEIAWYENVGDGTTWTQHTISSAADFAVSVFAADVDGDGDFDALSASSSDDTIAWYENLGGGTGWTHHTISTTASVAYAVFAADVDGDGDVDVLSASAGDNKIAWYENEGSGTVWTLHTISTSANFAYAVSVADVDGDGDLDVLSASGNDGKIAWYENVAVGSGWTLRTISTAADGARSVFVADVDGDGDLDALSASSNDNRIAWYRNDTIHRSALFVASPAISTSADRAQSVFAADVDGDGDLDALSASSEDGKIAWYERGGGGAWTPHTISITAAGARSVFAADVDGDGDLDVFSASLDDDEVAWYENVDGGGTSWVLHTISTTELGANSVFAADVDGDGDVDVLTASVFAKIAWYENVGDGSAWTLHTISTTVVNATSVCAADVDGDGDIDALSTSFNDHKVAWYENEGGGGTTWTLHTISTSAVGANAVSVADVDGDGDLDVLSASIYDNKIAWYENEGGGGTTWTLHTVSTTADYAYAVVAADVDGDGDLDVFAASQNDHEIAWYENAGGGTGWAKHTISTNAFGASSVVAADVDGDGDLDVLSASREDDTIAWYENRGGQVALATADTAPAVVGDSVADDVLRITMTHRGRTYGPGLDHDAELATLELGIDDGSGAPLSTPLTSVQANAVIDSLAVYLDDGDATFDGGDTLVTTVATLSLTGGVQTVAFDDGDPDVQVMHGVPETFFVVLETTADAGAQATDQLRITHVTAASSTAEDREADIPLTLEHVANVSSGVVAINGAPVAAADGPSAVEEDDTLNANAPGVLTNDSDPEDDSLSAVLETGPQHAASFNLASDGSFSYTPVAHYSGADSFTYHASDGIQSSNVVAVTLAVTPVADAPTLVTAPANGAVDTPIPLSITAALVDTDGSEALVITIANVPNGATLSAGTPLGGGTWQLTPAQLAGLTITPPPGSTSDFTLDVTATATETANSVTASTMVTLAVDVRANAIFADGFESGDTTAWD